MEVVGIVDEGSEINDENIRTTPFNAGEPAGRNTQAKRAACLLACLLRLSITINIITLLRNAGSPHARAQALKP